MAEPQIVNTLRSKRDELERVISAYEAAIIAARRDLAHINATLELFEKRRRANRLSVTISIVRMFKRGELFALCRTSLAKVQEGLDTRELALAVIRAKRMDETDPVLRKAIGFRVVQAMLRQKARGTVVATGKRKGTMVWIAK